MSPGTARLWSLDAFRGLTIAAMLLVNNPGRWSDTFIYPPLRHAAWNGWSPTDLIFPNFLFIVGVALVFSFTRRLEGGTSRGQLWNHVWRRSLVLVLLGLFLSRFPGYPRAAAGLGSAVAAAGPGGLLLRVGWLAGFVASVAFLIGPRHHRPWLLVLIGGAVFVLLGQVLALPPDRGWLWHHLGSARVPGVLQRIGICYAAAGGLYLLSNRPRFVTGTIILLLTVTAVWMRLVPIPGFGFPDLSIGLIGPGEPDVSATAVAANWCAYVDRHVFGIRCLHSLVDPDSRALVWTFDPEGLASTPAALATMMVGVLCGIWLRRQQPSPQQKLAGLTAAAVALFLGGALLGVWLPINKQLWTSSFALLTAGLALAVLAILFGVMEICRWRRWAMPLIWYGRNAITAFFLSSLAARLLVAVMVPTSGPEGAIQYMTLQTWIFETWFLPWTAPRNASLLYALSVVLFWTLFCWLLYRRRIFLKI